MDNVAKKIEIGANIAIIIVAILLSAVLIRSLVIGQQKINNVNNLPDSGKSNKPKIIGNSLTALPIDWSRSDKT